MNTESNPTAHQMLNKVPQLTLFFWIIKILCTTVGETAADFLNAKLGLGLTNTTYIMGALLVITLVFEFMKNKYVPGLYWLAVVLLSVVGTLITDNLTDNFKVPLVITTIIFSAALAATFAVWYAVEKSLSVHSIYSHSREAFYWTTILFTFALGTAAGDLVAEKLGLGYLVSLLLVATLIAMVTLAYYFLKLNGILAFWIAYVLTRPLGASLGDLMSQPHHLGGVGLGTTITSAIFLTAILGLVIYLAVTKRDVADDESLQPAHG